MHVIFENTNLDINKYKKVIYKKGDILFEEGQKTDYIGFVESGAISIKTYTYNEKEYEINNITDNGIFAQFILFTDNPIFLGTVIAEKETSVIYLTRKQILNALQNEKFAENYLKLTSKITLNIQKKVKLLTQKEIKDKILFLLYEHKKRNKTNIYPIKSKEKLASFLNVTRPSLSRELIKLRNEGIITYNKNYIILK